jgi:hypothetical protein
VLPPELKAKWEKSWNLQRDLERRLQPTLERQIRAVLNGQEPCAASRALLRVAGRIILLTLDQLPRQERSDWIRNFRPELEATRKSPRSISVTTYADGTFELDSPTTAELEKMRTRFAASHHRPKRKSAKDREL